MATYTPTTSSIRLSTINEYQPGTDTPVQSDQSRLDDNNTKSGRSSSPRNQGIILASSKDDPFQGRTRLASTTQSATSNATLTTSILSTPPSPTDSQLVPYRPNLEELNQAIATFLELCNQRIIQPSAFCNDLRDIFDAFLYEVGIPATHVDFWNQEDRLMEVQLFKTAPDDALFYFLQFLKANTTELKTFTNKVAHFDEIVRHTLINELKGYDKTIENILKTLFNPLIIRVEDQLSLLEHLAEQSPNQTLTKAAVKSFSKQAHEMLEASCIQATQCAQQTAASMQKRFEEEQKLTRDINEKILYLTELQSRIERIKKDVENNTLDTFQPIIENLSNDIINSGQLIQQLIKNTERLHTHS
jgi:hypothetical protein